jgi:ATP-dependent Lon protease
MKQAGSTSPVFVLDEIDKLGGEHRGDPSSALLEVLDPEQNVAFRDHYLGLPYDLSQVLFLATANHEGAIPPALRDRMEIIRLSGYSVVEKLHIARRHVIPRALEAAGLEPSDLPLSPRALRTIVEEYTREAGLRELERQIARLARKRARKIAERGRGPTPMIVARRLSRHLGAPPFQRDASLAHDADPIGAATGLAWTPWGGEVLHVEAQAMPGKGTLTLTGQLGDVMRESAQTALSCARARTGENDQYSDREIHIHVPAGAVPKDGPSAGVTMATALASLFAGVPVRRDVAMTGEITLRGRVLPVGGLKEKLLAAARTPSIKTVIIPAGNVGELDDLPRAQRNHLRERLAIVGAETLDDVLAAALVSPSQRRKSARGA